MPFLMKNYIKITIIKPLQSLILQGFIALFTATNFILASTSTWFLDWGLLEAFESI